MSANSLNGGKEPLFLETIPGEQHRLARADGTRLGVPLTASISSSGVIGFSPPGGPTAVVVTFPNFSPSVIASMVAGATASQSGTTVTISATAHGVPATMNGRRIWYPGSPSIPAQWLADLTVSSANAIIATAANSATVASESVNAGAAYTALTTLCQLSLKGGSMTPGSRFTVCMRRGGDTTTQKMTRVLVNGSAVASTLTTTQPIFEQRQSVRRVTDAQELSGAYVPDGSLTTSALYAVTADLSVDQLISVAGSVSAAGGYLNIDVIELEGVCK